ncbi:hypothetical protein [Haloarcula sp. CGMCC 1.6347]|uniref:hypothetical protein n=1 Tax=Haloarcula sp. CGMCC 1.6347 TaxID=3111455 RepID=UPI00300EFB28
MVEDDFSRNIEDLARDAERQSEKALYKHLKLHIFGPYQNDCYAYLTQLKWELQEKGFVKTALCTDRDGSPPPHLSDDEEAGFWREESLRFIDDSDVGVFIFLNHIFERENLQTKAREEAKDVGEDMNPREINISVAGELENWIQTKPNPQNRTLILFENGIYSDIGSVISGIPNTTDLDFETVPDEDIDSAIDEVRQRATNWVMNEMRDTLIHREHEQH